VVQLLDAPLLLAEQLRSEAWHKTNRRSRGVGWPRACQEAGRTARSRVARRGARSAERAPHLFARARPVILQNLFGREHARVDGHLVESPLAAQKLAQETPGQTLQATALVHEAYLRLVDGDQVQHWSSRGHFFAAAAEAMRRILIESAQPRAEIKVA
jgi:ECF sigma factor